MKIMKTTPILCVESIEESLPFWTDTLGFEKVVDVPHDGRIGFAILQKDASEIMLQTHPSMVGDLPEVAKCIKVGSICLYSEVESIEQTLAVLGSLKLLVPPRTTSYGAREVFVRDPDGNVLGFAEQQK